MGKGSNIFNYNTKLQLVNYFRFSDRVNIANPIAQGYPYNYTRGGSYVLDVTEYN